MVVNKTDFKGRLMEKKVRVFNSFEEENDAEHRRLAKMTHWERLEEFGILQERLWGKKWTEEPIVKVATWEKIDR